MTISTFLWLFKSRPTVEKKESSSSSEEEEEEHKSEEGHEEEHQRTGSPRENSSTTSSKSSSANNSEVTSLTKNRLSRQPSNSSTNSSVLSCFGGKNKNGKNEEYTSATSLPGGSRSGFTTSKFVNLRAAVDQRKEDDLRSGGVNNSLSKSWWPNFTRCSDKKSLEFEETARGG